GVVAIALALPWLPAPARCARPEPEPVRGVVGPIRVAWVQQPPSAAPLADPVPPAVIYNNTSSSNYHAITSNVFRTVWGDRISTTGTGILQELSFGIFNSLASAGDLTSFVIQLGVRDGSSQQELTHFIANG